jgi:hypothetical protein
MTTKIEEFDELTNALTMEAEKLTKLPAAGLNPCAIWKTAKPAVELIIKALTFFSFLKWAKIAAQVLTDLDKALSSVCP